MFIEYISTPLGVMVHVLSLCIWITKKIDECIFQLMNLINLSFDSIYQSSFNFDYRFLLANCYYLGSELLYLWSWYSHNISIVISGCKYRFIWALLCKYPKVLSLHLSILLSIHKTNFGVLVWTIHVFYPFGLCPILHLKCLHVKGVQKPGTRVPWSKVMAINLM